jgi:hypothetical protein
VAKSGPKQQTIVCTGQNAIWASGGWSGIASKSRLFEAEKTGRPEFLLIL